MLWLRECAQMLAQKLEPAAIGPKARRLAEAREQGLPVPDGFVVLPDEVLDERQLAANLEKLSASSRLGLFAVRSSASQEDLAGRSAAGLFLSRTHVPRDQVGQAILDVRASGQSEAVVSYCGQPVPVAVLVQPMLAAERLGVLHVGTDGKAVCEERLAEAPEWANVTTRALPVSDSSPLGIGARKLAALLGASAAYIEYGLGPNGAVSFLQVRPAPPAPTPQGWPTLAAEPEGQGLVYIHDQEHNPDPLSAAQSGLVDGVADLAPGLRQRVYGGYLYYAEQPAATSLPAVEIQGLGQRYAAEIVPACEALLLPLERLLVAGDGALDRRQLADPGLCELPLAGAWAAYRGVYRLYVSQLGPALRGARQQLDQLLRQNLGEPLSDPRHSMLLAGAATAPTERLQLLWELGRAGAPEPLLRTYLGQYGAFASCWDIAVPCDDERPEWVRLTALRLAQPGASAQVVPSPRQLHEAAEASHRVALERLLVRLPQPARDELAAILPAARTAQRIAEEDDALFFRAQRLVRWALLHRGALLCQAQRLDRIEQIFDLPWRLQTEQLDDFAAASFAAGRELRQLAAEGQRERVAAQALVPPARLVDGQPLWTPPRAEVLHGCGVVGAQKGLVRGRAHVVRTLLPGDHPSIDVDLAAETILVLPALLPSWASELWRARALVTDSGGALSHGAILAREHGVPAVVGTRVATRTIAEGQELWVDAERGRVYLLPQAAASIR